MEKKIDACASLAVESGEGSANWRERNVQNDEANHLNGAISSHQLLSIDFLRSAFSE
jgi:hypothetical protein